MCNVKASCHSGKVHSLRESRYSPLILAGLVISLSPPSLKKDRAKTLLPLSLSALPWLVPWGHPLASMKNTIQSHVERRGRSVALHLPTSMGPRDIKSKAITTGIHASARHATRYSSSPSAPRAHFQEAAAASKSAYQSVMFLCERKTQKTLAFFHPAEKTKGKSTTILRAKGLQPSPFSSSAGPTRCRSPARSWASATRAS